MLCPFVSHKFTCLVGRDLDAAYDTRMAKNNPADFDNIRRTMTARLIEQVEADRDSEGGEICPQFRYFIDSGRNDYPLGGPKRVEHDDDTGQRVILYEFPVIESDRKVITALGDGHELLMTMIPTAQIIRAYIEFHIANVIYDDRDGLLLCFNPILRYWHLAEARIVKATYDTRANGFWTRE